MIGKEKSNVARYFSSLHARRRACDFPARSPREDFSKYIVPSEFPLSTVDFPDGGHAQIFGAEDDEISSLMFNHITSELALEAIYEIMDETDSILYCTGDPLFIAPRESTIDELPPEMAAEERDWFRIAHSGKELRDLIWGPET